MCDWFEVDDGQKKLSLEGLVIELEDIVQSLAVGIERLLSYRLCFKIIT